MAFVEGPFAAPKGIRRQEGKMRREQERELGFCQVVCLVAIQNIDLSRVRLERGQQGGEGLVRAANESRAMLQTRTNDLGIRNAGRFGGHVELEWCIAGRNAKRCGRRGVWGLPHRLSHEGKGRNERDDEIVGGGMLEAM